MNISSIRELLIPEFEAEASQTRRLFEALPDGDTSFKPHERSMSLGRLAGHITDIYRYISFMLANRDFDLAADRPVYTMEDKASLFAQFEDNVRSARSTLQQTDDAAFRQHCIIRRGTVTLFEADRYTYYRLQGINQIVHHRAQLGTYVRALDIPLPGMYGRSADGI